LKAFIYIDKAKEKRLEKNKKASKPLVVFFGSFLDTKKELGCGAKPHCYQLGKEKAR